MVSVTEIRRDLYRSLVWTFAAPTFVALVTYGVSVIVKVNNPFVANFGAGDLLPVGAIILMTVKLDFDKIPLEDRSPGQLFAEEALLLWSLVLWIAYGALKVYALSLQGSPVSDDADVKATALQLGIISVLTYVATIVWAIYLRLSVSSAQIKGVRK